MSQKIIITKGLPASGKSTWAKKMVEDNPGQYKRINKDDLRAMMDNSRWSKSNETFVKKVRDWITMSALINGLNVIIDDTNLDDSHEIRMKEIAKALLPREVEVEIKDFTGVSLDECIKRDKNRANSVSEKVIRGMYNQYLKPEVPKIERNPLLPDAIIVDIDGTVALMNNRGPYDFDKVDTDLVNTPVKKVIDAMISDHITVVIFCSGREDLYRKKTVKWMDKNDILHDFLYMRETGDKRNDSVVKQEIYDNKIKGKYNILAVFDDRQRVVDMWRQNGLPVFQVADGDF